MPKLIDVTRLSPMRRGFLAGYRRARVKAKAKPRATLQVTAQRYAPPPVVM